MALPFFAWKEVGRKPRKGCEGYSRQEQRRGAQRVPSFGPVPHPFSDVALFVQIRF